MNSYRNIMEVLVEEETGRQLCALSNQKRLETCEIVSYALNRLPVLYASTQKGFQCQLQRGRVEYGLQVFQAVQAAIAAVKNKPEHSATPIRQQDRAAWSQVVGSAKRLAKQRQKASQWHGNVGCDIPGIAVRPTLSARYRVCPQIPLDFLISPAASAIGNLPADSIKQDPSPQTTAVTSNPLPNLATDEIPTLLNANEGIANLSSGSASFHHINPIVPTNAPHQQNVRSHSEDSTNLFNAIEEPQEIDRLQRWLEQEDEDWWNNAFYQI